MIHVDAVCGLRPLAATWRTFPGARRSNGRGLETRITGVEVSQ